MGEPNEPSDEDLLERSRAGDEVAFTTLYRRRQPGLFRFALRMSGLPAMAEDVVQDVFMILIHAPERFSPQAGSLATFLYGIARNRVRRHLEKVARHVPLEGPEGERSAAPTDPPEADLFRLESVAALRGAILSLPEAYREVVVLVELEELSYAEAAVALGCAVGTIRSRLHRARRLLLERLRGNGVLPAGARRDPQGRYA
jgi:RNA polymerase sigma-70 factor (ECF subfamily)